MSKINNVYRASVNRKSRVAAQLWHDKWGFYNQIEKIKEEEALKIGNIYCFRVNYLILSLKVFYFNMYITR